jgi:hypothetical protein
MDSLFTAILSVGPGVAVAIAVAILNGQISLLLEFFFYGNRRVGVLLSVVRWTPSAGQEPG